MIDLRQVLRWPNLLLIGVALIAAVAAGVWSQSGGSPAEVVEHGDAVAEAPVDEVAAEPQVADPVIREEPADAPIPWVVSAPLPAPGIEVIRDGVVLTSDASDGEPMAEGDTAVPNAGDALLAGDGSAVVTWGDGLRAEMLPGSELSIQKGDLDERRVSLTQPDGTVRYFVRHSSEEGGPAAVLVDAGSMVVAADSAGGQTADLLVAFSGPDDDRAAWAVVLSGEATVQPDALVATAGAANSNDAVELEAGQAVAVRDGAPSRVVPVDPVAIESWYGERLAGLNKPIAQVTFACIVREGGTVVRDGPGDDQEQVRWTTSGDRVDAGLALEIAGRVEDGSWLMLRSEDAADRSWVAADTVDCIAPVTHLPKVEAVDAQPTPDYYARAGLAETEASFTISDSQITAGDCAMLRWDVPVGSDIRVAGQPFPGKGFRSVCPDRTTTYQLTYVGPDGKPVTREIEVRVREPVEQVAMAQGEQGGADAAPQPTPEPTECLTDECIFELPTPLPTRTPRPRPTEEPTEAVATQPPEATEPPAGPTQAGDDPPTPTPVPTGLVFPTQEPTETFTPTPVPTGLVFPTATATLTPTMTVTLTPSPSAPPPGNPSATPTPLPTATPTPPGMASSTPVPTEGP